jgi:hypothetical protein
MPNWCMNDLELNHKDRAMLVKAEKAFKKGKFLNAFIPVPIALKKTMAGFAAGDEQAKLEKKEQANLKKYGYKNWYDFCIGEWGTKWDVGGGEDSVFFADKLTLGFDSAWSPPVEAYYKLQELGFEILAYWYEPGMSFAGRFDADGEANFDIHGPRSMEKKKLPEDIFRFVDGYYSGDWGGDDA